MLIIPFENAQELAVKINGVSSETPYIDFTYNISSTRLSVQNNNTTAKLLFTERPTAATAIRWKLRKRADVDVLSKTFAVKTRGVVNTI